MAAGEPVNAAVGVAFTNLDPDGGQAEGAPTFARAANESNVTEYRLYSGQNATTKLAGNDTIIETVPAGGGASWLCFLLDLKSLQVGVCRRVTCRPIREMSVIRGRAAGAMAVTT